MSDYTVADLADDIANERDDFYDDLWNYGNPDHPQATVFGDAVFVNASTEYDEGRCGQSLVFRIGDRHFRKTGYYDSWAGGEWDGELEEVRPREKTIVVYDSI